MPKVKIYDMNDGTMGPLQFPGSSRDILAQ